MPQSRPEAFRGRHFEPTIILTCVRWYLRFALSFRDLAEMMAERNLSVDHVTIWRWVQRYAPELNRRCRPELRQTNRSWRVDETYLRVAGKWVYLYRAVDSNGDTIDFLLSARRDLSSGKRFLQKALRSITEGSPRVINVDGNPSYPAAIRELKRSGQLSKRCRCPYGQIIGQASFQIRINDLPLVVTMSLLVTETQASSQFEFSDQTTYARKHVLTEVEPSNLLSPTPDHSSA